VTYSNVKGGFPGTGNIDSDPYFVDPMSVNFLLKQAPCQPGYNNPCVDTGSDTAANLGMDALWTRTDEVPDAGQVDMGYHYGPKDYHWFDALGTNIYEISETTGDKVFFLLNAGTMNAGREYILLGGITGTAPGTPLPGGEAVLPLNWDLFTTIVINLINSAVFKDFTGTLDVEGRSVAVMTSGPIPGAAGLVLQFAYGLHKPWDFASNTVFLRIVF
jgi:hypothetical protein